MFCSSSPRHWTRFRVAVGEINPKPIAPPVARRQDGRLICFDSNTLQSALHQSGFEQVIVQPGPILPARARFAKTLVTLSRPALLPAWRTLSVVVPAYNEANTVRPLLDALLAKRLPGIRIEVIVVESNSTDGTRDIVCEYAAHPRVQAGAGGPPARQRPRRANGAGAARPATTC